MVKVRPLIGIVGRMDYSTGRLFLDSTHLRNVISAGGLPSVFGVNGSPEDVLKHVDGILLIEGPDVHPRAYGEDPSESIKYVDVARDEFEIRLVRLAVEEGIPLLGIGRGMQVINVALGGTLYQDVREIPKAIKHDWDPDSMDPRQRVHGLRIKTSSMLYELLKEVLDIGGTNEVFMRVNSFHHQAVKRVGDGLKPVAYADDGLTEAIEGEGNFVIGLQWQAEYLPEMDVLFEAFVRAARDYRSEKLELSRREIEAEVREELNGNRHSSDTNDTPPDMSQT
ncbi:gamma-glutamyl-gamma-aminobutyrate hydrolase family protein [Thermococcus sp.]|uniref:gamma-glutamyl-gamma-aminobutyrate hydrolase family protein n=1 Tax=Thermococcus sp. TaxID=35749 RepID=UPI00345D3AD5